MKVGSECVVGRDDSKQPPWSTEMSTSTEPGFIRADQLVRHQHRRLRAGHQHRADHQVRVEAGLLDLVRVGRDRLQVALVDLVRGAQLVDVRSSSSTSACMPSAIAAAFIPETPAPSTTTFAAYTPERRPSAHRGRPAPAPGVCAPTCGAIRPATSDIGASSGSAPSAVCTVSYATASMPDFSSASRALARRGQVQVGEQGAAGPHPPVLLGDRLLHLQHQVDVPDVVRRRRGSPRRRRRSRRPGSTSRPRPPSRRRRGGPPPARSRRPG